MALKLGVKPDRIATLTFAWWPLRRKIEASLWREFISHLRSDRYDVRIFEILPLHIKMSVIEEGVVLYSRDELELYEYFYPFRREWEDQKHRHVLGPGEVSGLIAAARSARAGDKS